MAENTLIYGVNPMHITSVVYKWGSRNEYTTPRRTHVNRHPLYWRILKQKRPFIYWLRVDFMSSGPFYWSNARVELLSQGEVIYTIRCRSNKHASDVKNEIETKLSLFISELHITQWLSS
jgi:hypothetical protein